MVAALRMTETRAHTFEEGYKRSRNLVRALRKDDAVGALLESCNSIGEAFLFGGAVRDTMFGSRSFGDLDIFVSGPINEELISRLAKSSRRTNFGGFRLVVGKFDVDIWELPKSYAFRIDRGRAISVDSLLSTVCFSTDAVAISLQTAKIRADKRFRRSLETNTLSFVQKPLASEVLQAVRIARMVVKLGIRPDREVSRYFLDAVRQFGADVLLGAEAKWKGRRVLDSELLIAVIRWCELGQVGPPPLVEKSPMWSVP